ncbi:hypothetical protein [Pseudoxanthomonas sp. UTMC 1351]|uniref:hypothetical protein n=1 Tax=Pseudoxanthomonas sp. UTMC 1351 TaxID=2695853 RepID=UPI0034CF3363
MNTQHTHTEAVETAELISALADQLAAVADSLIKDGGATPAGLEVFRDRLGEIHVEADQLGQDIRELEAAAQQTTYGRFLGVAA